MSFSVFIPIIPPGINETYGINCRAKRKMYKTKKAKDWQKSAIMPIRSAANTANFIIDKNDRLTIDIQIFDSNYDIDAPVKLIIDTIANVLDFNDKIVSNVAMSIIRKSDKKGIFIDVRKEIDENYIL